MLKLCRVTKVRVLFPVLVYLFNFDLFEVSAAILEEGLDILGFEQLLASKSNIVHVYMYVTSVSKRDFRSRRVFQFVFCPV